ncbi:MAG: ribonuclease P [Euryarchaeota archaeon]|nr:ribonuclease P [Euryarchaeota archaeon]
MLKIAKERIDILFKLADKEFSEHPERSHRYVEIARNIATRYNIRMPRIWRRRFCKNCYLFLKPGYNSQVRLSKSCVVIRCFECGSTMRVPYIKEKKGKRRERIESHIIKKRTDE